MGLGVDYRRGLVVALLVATAMTAPAGAQEQPKAHANYIFETHYELRAGAADAFDDYWAALQDGSRRGALAIVRYVDSVDDPERTRRVVSLPVAQLAEYGLDRRNEDMLRSAMGAEAAAAIISAFNQAQESRTSYLRQYRPDLSVNRERHHRGSRAEVSMVTTVEGREPVFERVWRRAADAYRRVAPESVVVVARTLVGGGPQFEIVRPLREGYSLDPVEAVRRADGASAARTFETDLREVVVSWRTATYTNLGFDTIGHVQEAHR
jgi:hypothetical protein